MTTARPATARDATLDIARGIAIIMIVLGHVLRGLASAGILDRHGVVYADSDDLLYSVHLTVFAFISGLFVSRVVTRDGPGRYLRSRDALFVYLYVIWSLIQGAVMVAASAVTNSKTNVEDVLNLLHPDGQLWFLPWLVVVTTVAAIVRPWRTRALAVVAVVGALVVSVVWWGTDFGVVGAQGLGIWVFFFLGVCLGSDRVLAAMSRRSLPTAIIGACVGIVVYVVLVLDSGEASPTPSLAPVHGIVSVALGIITTTVGLVAVLCVSRVLASVRGFRWLATVGQNTMVVFLASITFASGTRILLAHAGIHELAVHVVLGTAVGVIGPLALSAVLTRIRLPWLFAAPAWVTGRRSAHARR